MKPKIAVDIAYYSGEVEPRLVAYLVGMLSTAHDAETTVLFIDTPGGDAGLIETCVFLLRAIERKTRLYVVNTSEICSAGVDIFIQCENRAMLSRSLFLIHKSRSYLDSATADNAEEVAKALKKLDKTLEKDMFELIKMNKADMEKFNKGGDVTIQGHAKCKKAGLVNVDIRDINEIL